MVSIGPNEFIIPYQPNTFESCVMDHILHNSALVLISTTIRKQYLSAFAHWETFQHPCHFLQCKESGRFLWKKIFSGIFKSVYAPCLVFSWLLHHWIFPFIIWFETFYCHKEATFHPVHVPFQIWLTSISGKYLSQWWSHFIIPIAYNAVFHSAETSIWMA